MSPAGTQRKSFRRERVTLKLTENWRRLNKRIRPDSIRRDATNLVEVSTKFRLRPGGKCSLSVEMASLTRNVAAYGIRVVLTAKLAAWDCAMV
ncbi:hypothetical protein AHiyo1_42570 [Arthrobacter sp. Hiyo1]|nr:hypothetical protein AHiyo1_42570 [Arthrobacter sp. Hiyo1]